jgi:hypothetical protein
LALLLVVSPILCLTGLVFGIVNLIKHGRNEKRLLVVVLNVLACGGVAIEICWFIEALKALGGA